MRMTFTEKIRVMLVRHGMTIGELAAKTNQSRQNLSNKMARGNFSEKEMRDIAQAFGCEFNPQLIMKDTGETL